MSETYREQNLNDMLQDDEHWQSYIEVVGPKVQEKLGDRGFLIACTFFEQERAGELTRRGIKDIFTIILQGDSTPFRSVWKHDWYMDHDMEGPTDL